MADDTTQLGLDLAREIEDHERAVESVESDLFVLQDRVEWLAATCLTGRPPKARKGASSVAGQINGRAQKTAFRTLAEDELVIDKRVVPRDHDGIIASQLHLAGLRRRRRTDEAELRQARAQVDADTQLLNWVNGGLPAVAQALRFDLGRRSGYYVEIEQVALRHGDEALKSTLDRLKEGDSLNAGERRNARAGILHLRRRVNNALVRLGTIAKTLAQIEAQFATWLALVRGREAALDSATDAVREAARARFAEIITIVATVFAVPALVAAVFGANVDLFRQGHEAPLGAMLVLMGASAVVALSALTVLADWSGIAARTTGGPRERRADQFLVSAFVVSALAAVLIWVLKDPPGRAGKIESVACFVAALSAVGAYLWRQTATPAQPRVVVGDATDPREAATEQPGGPESAPSASVAQTPPGLPSTAHPNLRAAISRAGRDGNST